MNSNQNLVSLFSAIDRSLYGKNLNYYLTFRLSQTIPLSFYNSVPVANARLFYNSVANVRLFYNSVPVANVRLFYTLF